MRQDKRQWTVRIARRMTEEELREETEKCAAKGTEVNNCVLEYPGNIPATDNMSTVRKVVLGWLAAEPTGFIGTAFKNSGDGFPAEQFQIHTPDNWDENPFA